MSSEVTHLVDRKRDFPLVRFAGVLDASTAGEVRSVLLDVLADQPEALVVDVADLRLTEPADATVLRELRRDTADWPGSRLALCGVHDPGWHDSGWPVWPDLSGAYSDLGAPAPDARVKLELDPLVGAARRSRELITEACRRWGRTELAGPACIVATELVNNVVAHARTQMVVFLAVRGEGLSVAVRDRSPVTPTYTPGPVSPTAYGGRGMLLIDSVAARWGSLALSDGKVVWALLEPEPETPGPTGDRGGRASMPDPARG